MRFITILLCLLITQTAFTQTPSKEEMQNQMAQVTKELNKQITDLEKQIADAKKNREDTETIKNLEDQLAMYKKQVSMMSGLTKNISGMSDKVIKQATQKNEPGIVPKRDVARIKQLPDKILTDAELTPFVKKVHTEVEKLLNSEDKAEAQKIYTALKAEKRSSNYIDNAANSLWTSGYPEIALYVLGKECMANMKDANILNNYAALLTMQGGEHAALPILQNLNNKFPDNSTILNNIGQAWYGLGDMNKAKQNLTGAMRVYGLHSQANQTMCLIQESEGNTAGAMESIKKSIKENYTPEKEAKLNELGGKLEYDDIPFRYPAKAEPLGIEKFMFTIPAYPFEGGTTAEQSSMEWDDFRRKVWDVMEKLNAEERVKEKQVQAYQKLLLANPQILKPYNTTVYKTSARKLALLYEWYTDRLVALSKKIYAAGDTVEKWRNEMNEAYKALGDKATCGARKSIATNFVSKSNTLWQQRNAELLSLEKQKLNAEATYALYGTHDRSIYEMLIVKIKQSFLILLGNMHCEFEVGCIPTEPDKPHGKVLPDFDSVNCQYTEEFIIPPFTKIKIECNKMTTEFDIDTELGLKIKLGKEENLNSGKVTKGTLEIGYEVGTDVAKFGPVGAELKGQLGAGIEVNGDGVQEVYIKGSSTIDVAGNIGKSEITLTPRIQSEAKGLSTMSAEVKVSLNVGSGPNHGTMNSSLSGQGLLTPVNISLH